MEADKKLQLRDVTLVAMDTVCSELTYLAVNDCMRQADFGDVKVFTIHGKKDFGVSIEPFASVEEAGEFQLYKMPDYVSTSHILFIEFDSWIIDPSMWRDEFLCDYIGAPWWWKDQYNVGNSGFCIRSKELMLYLREHRDKFPMVMPEDHTLCRKYRPMLEPQFKWADEKTARDFSFERIRPAIDSRHFGFHGIFNWPFVMSNVDFANRMEIARRTPYLQQDKRLQELHSIWFALWGRHLVEMRAA